MRAAVVMALVVVTLGGQFESGAARGAAVTAAVTVRTDAARYRAGQTIVVTISNGLAVPVVAATGHASCSIVSLDRRTTLGWVEVRNCYAGVPPVLVRIAPGATVRVPAVHRRGTVRGGSVVQSGSASY